MFKNILFTIILLFFPLSSWGAILYVFPQSQSVWQGDTFIVEVRLDTDGQTLNSVEGYLNFPQDELEVLGISEGGSVLTLWIQKPLFSNERGLISFAGGIPKGFSGQDRLFSVMFRGKGERAELGFSGNSRVFLDDGLGTQAPLSFGEGEYKITPKTENLPIITSSSHPDQDKWYNKANLDLRWKLIDGVEYSYLLSQDPIAEPDEIADKPEGALMWQGDMTYKGLPEGIYYFHLRQKAKGDWTPKVTYRAMIDATGPESFQPEIAGIEGKNYLVFNASDQTSGVDYYEVQEKGGSWQKAQSPYLLQGQKLSGKVSVKAVDRAGNETFGEYAPLPQKEEDRTWIVAVAILIGLSVVLLLRKRYAKKNK